jgi:ABC-2 type transport system permease protein
MPTSWVNYRIPVEYPGKVRQAQDSPFITRISAVADKIIRKYSDNSQSNQSALIFIKSLYVQRELLALLVLGDLKSRYRRSYVGLLWTLINPILSSLVLWAVFVSIFKASLINGTQFAPYLLAGVLTITFFNQGLLQGAESVSNGSRLFLKIRVDPRLFCVSKVLSNAFNFFLGSIALAIVSWVSGANVSMKFPLIIFVGFCLTVMTIGFSMIFSVLFIRFDDIKYIVTILLQLLTYMTPVFYPKQMLNTQMEFIVSLNPLSSFLDVFRNVFNGTEVATVFDWAYMFGSSTFAFIIGVIIFKKYWMRTVIML